MVRAPLIKINLILKACHKLFSHASVLSISIWPTAVLHTPTAYFFSENLTIIQYTRYTHHQSIGTILVAATTVYNIAITVTITC